VNITDICLKKPVFAWMLMFGTILMGVLAISRIGISQFPDVDNPTISVSISWPGAAPEDVETGIINPIEDAMSQVTGVLTMTSSAKTGSARITATFDLSRNIDLALQDTQAKIAQTQRSLPTSAQVPIVSKSNPDDQPIITVGLSGPFSRALLADIARYQLEDSLETLPGVGQIQMMGYLDRNIRIWVDAEKLVASNVTVSDVISAVQKQHISVPGGEMDNGGLAFDVRFLGEATDLQTLRGIVVSGAGSMSPVHLSDVALVQDGFVDITSYARSNGETVQALGILKQPGSNAVAVANSVRKAIGDLNKTLPPGMKLEVIFDTTVFINESVNEIAIELGLAVILTAFVCWIFLGSLSATMNVLFAIPMSLLGTIAVLYFCGFTLNTFTLLGLSLAVGLVVDDAVMVMENIFRHAEMGKDRVTAASEGTKEITFAALAATLAVIAIFMPVAFMSGVVGKFFLQFGITLSVAVAISYVEAISLAPARCAQMLTTSSHENRGFIGRLADRGFDALSRFYSRALHRSLEHPWIVLATGVAVMGLSVLVALRIPQEFVPSQDQSRLSVRLTTSVGANLQATDALVRRAEAFLTSRPEVIDVMSSVGGSATNSASLSVTMVDPSERKLTQAQFATVIRNELSSYPGLKAAVQDLSQQGFGASKGYPIEFSVRGSDWDTLVAQAMKIKLDLAASGLATDVDSDYQVGSPELMISPDRERATDLGINVSDIASSVSALIGGVVIGQYSTGGRRIDVNLRLQSTQRSRPEDLGLLRMRTSKGILVPLSSVVLTKQVAELQAINHADRERAITITGNIAAGHAQGEVITYVNSLSAGLPVGYHVVMSGASSSFSDSMNSLIFALIVGILVAYMVLASQFNSFLDPVTVLTILPLSLAGAMFAIAIAGKTLNIFSMIGLLLLMGIVKKNSIILVDYAKEIREHEGLDAKTAMLKAGPVRLRPILMTAVATMMAAVPSAMGIGPGKETRGPMADAVIGGLVLSTALSLLVVPAFYVVADRLRSKKAPTGEGTGAHAPPAPASDHAQ
jgi:hydrophobe/amphiphile efflux-1 (HAE1) family protein